MVGAFAQAIYPALYKVSIFQNYNKHCFLIWFLWTIISTTFTLLYLLM